jgi:hypothetical protein
MIAVGNIVISGRYGSCRFQGLYDYYGYNCYYGCYGYYGFLVIKWSQLKNEIKEICKPRPFSNSRKKL